ncbi:MAG: helicase, partial [Deltaproteobacteria bacterium]|nr:helicase [Deltaproteobacteria bacterium]
MTHIVPGGGGLEIVISVGQVRAQDLLPPGTRSVSVFVVNQRAPAPDQRRDAAYAFQVQLSVQAPEPFVPRPNLSGGADDDWDDQVADLQYRDAVEYAVGHNTSALAVLDLEGSCRMVRSCWVPTAEVEKVIATRIADVERGMEALAAAATAEDVRRLVGPMVEAYRAWIGGQRTVAVQGRHRTEVAAELMNRAVQAAGRIEAG